MPNSDQTYCMACILEAENTAYSPLKKICKQGEYTVWSVYCTESQGSLAWEAMAKGKMIKDEERWIQIDC